MSSCRATNAKQIRARVETLIEDGTLRWSDAQVLAVWEALRP